MSLMGTTTETTSQWEAVYETLPTVEQGWTTAKAVAEVTGMTPSTVTRRLGALEEGGRVESSTDKAVTGVRGRVWRQKPARVPAADSVTDADRDAALVVIAKALDAGVIDAPPAEVVEPDPDSMHAEEFAPAPVRACDECGEAIHPTEAEAGYTRCEACDPDGDHTTGTGLETVELPAEDVPADVARAAQDRDAEAPEPDDDADNTADRNPAEIESPLVDDEDGDPSPVSPAPTGGDVAAIAEWMESQRTANPLTADDARALTDRIRIQVTELLPLIKEAWTRRADLALGYDSWAAYCDTELRGLRMPLAERQAATAELRAEGMSTRAIGGALGVSDGTVRNDLAGAQNYAPAAVTGSDGKTYPAQKPAKPATQTPAAAAAGSPAGPATSTPDPRAETASRESRPEDRPGPTTDEPDEPDPVRVRAHAWQVMNPGALVWIAISRLGIDYHRPVGAPTHASALFTGCGRSMRTGERISIADVENELSAKPCPRCWPDDEVPTEPAPVLAPAPDGPTDVATDAAGAVRRAIDQHLPADPDEPHRAWRDSFRKGLVTAYRVMSLSTADEVAEHADEECMAELARYADELARFTSRVRDLRAAAWPDNVIPMTRS